MNIDFGFEFWILLNLNKGINLKKVHKLKKFIPTVWHALLKIKKKKPNIELFFKHGTTCVSTSRVMGQA